MAMSRQILRYGSFLFALVIMAVLVISWSFSSPEGKPDVFPQKLSERLNLPGYGDPREVSKVFYKADGFTPDHAEVSFRNGETGTVVFRPDFTVSEYRVFYADDTGGPVLKAFVAIDRDGKSVLEERRYREDGSLFAHGARLASGDYEIFHFAKDGITRNERHQYRQSGTLFAHDGYYPDGKVAFEKVIKNVIESKETRYYPDGKKSYEMAIYGNTVDGSTWYESGVLKTRIKKYTSWENYSSLSNVKVEYYKPDGVLEQERVFRYDGISVHLNIAGGGSKVTQTWKMIDLKKEVEHRYDADNFRLDSISFDQFDGHKNVRYLFPADSTGSDYVMEEIYSGRESAKGPLRYYVSYVRKDGSIFKREVRNATSGVLSTEYSGSGGSIDSEKILIPDEAMSMLDSRSPPFLPTPPEYYDYY